MKYTQNMKSSLYLIEINDFSVEKQKKRENLIKLKENYDRLK